MQGKLDEAEPLMMESLAIRKKAFGSGHPQVAVGLNNLAELYKAQASSALLVRCCPLCLFAAGRVSIVHLCGAGCERGAG